MKSYFAYNAGLFLATAVIHLALAGYFAAAASLPSGINPSAIHGLFFAVASFYGYRVRRQRLREGYGSNWLF